MSIKQPSNKKLLTQNRRARFDYDISEIFTCGIVLKGSEVKSVKASRVSLRDSFVRVEQGEVWLIQAHIAKWIHDSKEEYNPKRRRKLLLSKSEIKKLSLLQDAKKMSIIPLEFILHNNMIKLKIGVGRGRRKYDKRAKIRREETERQIRDDLAKIENF
jgi:SsrA-binding protein